MDEMNITLVLMLVVTCNSLTTVDWISREIPEEDYDVLNYQPQNSSSIQQWSFSGTVPSTGRKYTLHVGSLNSGLPGAFTFELPKGG